jgi:GWxTD domain-containing protein
MGGDHIAWEAVMHSRLLAVVACSFFILSMVPCALAQDAEGESLLEWDRSPAGFLMTKDEKKAWKKISTEAEAKAFIELFWAKRNPEPASAFNPFKADFENKVRYADEQYSWEKKRGSLTDRGRVLILMGAPHASENRFPTQIIETVDDNAAGTDDVRANAKLWFYDPQQIPNEFGIKGSRILFTFYEEKAESNNFILDRSHQEAMMGLRALTRAPEVYVLHPKLKEVPKPVSVPGGSEPTAAQLAWLDTDPAPLDDELRTVAKVAVADAANRPLWVHLELPADAPELDTLAGRVSTADGDVESTFQIAGDPRPTMSGTAYHLTFPLSPGDYTVEVAGAAGDAPQVVWADSVEIPPTPTEGTWMTPLMLGLDFTQEQDWKLGYPFAYGSLHLVPMTDTALPNTKEISYFGHVIRPGLNDAGKAELEVEVTLEMDGTRLGRPFKMNLDAIEIADDLYVYANGLSLAGLPQTGTYDITFEVTDTISEVSVQQAVTLDITVE